MLQRALAPLLTVLILALALAAAGLPVSAATDEAPLPATLADTGLYADPARGTLHPDVLAFSPQYPLWSDGADKQRWLRLPPGTAIDASRPDAWQFPPGTRLWKTFGHAGRAVETRYAEQLASGRWRFAVYQWNDSGTQAVLAPARGAMLAVPQAPGGRYEVPARGDCLVCHDSAAVPVLGFSAVQLSSQLPQLAARGLLHGLPPALRGPPPVIAADNAAERAALGYLHGNCGHCHNHDGSPAPVPLRLAQAVGDPVAARQRVLDSVLGVSSRFRPAVQAEAPLVAPGQPGHSVLLQRLRSRQPNSQMPPLGTRVADAEGLALVERWIASLPAPKP